MKQTQQEEKKKCIAMTKRGEQCKYRGVFFGYCIPHWKKHKSNTIIHRSGERKPFRRPCDRCEKNFQPTSYTNRICIDCYEKSKKVRLKKYKKVMAKKRRER